MKRQRSPTEDIMIITSSKEPKLPHNDDDHDDVPPIQNLAKELQTEIFARIAARSCDDIVNCKLSCKNFKEVAEEQYIYHHVCLDRFPIIPWFPQTQTQQTFLEKCRQSQNAELFYRQAVIDYFSREELTSAYEGLQRAANSGHEGALYLSCITDLFRGDEESREKGVKLLAKIMKSSDGKKKLRDCRRKLRDHLSMIWVRNHLSMRPRPVCSKVMEDNHKKIMRWDIREYEDSITCEACLADFQVNYICGEYINS